MSLFPSELDVFPNPSGSTPTQDTQVPHAELHVLVNQAVAALQTKVGVDASTDQDSIEFKLARALALASREISFVTPTGSVNGVNTVFILPEAITSIGTVQFLAGNRPISHTLAGDGVTATLSQAPSTTVLAVVHQ